LIFNKGTLRIRVAAVLIKEGRILLIAHKKGKNVYWLLPGGGVHFGESLKQALRREIKEELGISIRVHDLVFINDSIEPGNRRHILHICFNSAYEEGEYQLGRERRLYTFRYFSEEEIADLTIFPPVNRDLVSLLQGKGVEEIYQEKRWIPL
jgi:8-oxo-dGTP diphosphatase